MKLSLNINYNIIVILLAPPLLYLLFINRSLRNWFAFKLCFILLIHFLMIFMIYFQFIILQFLSIFFLSVHHFQVFIFFLDFIPIHFFFINFNFFFFILIINFKSISGFIFGKLKHFLIILFDYPYNSGVYSYEPSK